MKRRRRSPTSSPAGRLAPPWTKRRTEVRRRAERVAADHGRRRGSGRPGTRWCSSLAQAGRHSAEGFRRPGREGTATNEDGLPTGRKRGTV